MTKGIFALEDNLEQSLAVTPEMPVEEIMLVQQQNDVEIESLAEATVEAEENVEVLNEMERVMDTEENLPVAAMEAFKNARTHLLNRLGYKGDVSMESFKLSSSDFAVGLDKNVSIAQEGILERMGHGLKYAFTSMTNLSKQNATIVDHYSARTPTTTDIVEPGWGRIFTMAGKRKIDGNDVISSLAKYDKILSNTALHKSMKEVADILKNVAVEVNKSRFIAKDESVEEIKKLTSDSDKIVAALEKSINLDMTVKYDSVFKPLDAKQVSRVHELVTKVLDNHAYEQALKNFEQAIDTYNEIMYGNFNVRLAGGLAADIKAAVSFVSKINPVLIDMYTINSNRTKACYSAIQYIKASAKK
jgi:hypothetical protein